MFKRFVLTSGMLAQLMAVPTHAQDQVISLKNNLIVGDGPFEVKGESGVIGFVVARAGDLVTFKPCTGASFPLDRKQLLATKNKCENSPSTDEHPLIVKCGDALQGWDKVQIAQAVGSNVPIGTAFFQKEGETAIASVTLNPNQMASAIDSVDQFKDCGQFVVGFDKEGEAKVSLIPAMQAIQLDGEK
ncbi:hypothetical protein [Mesorhizobium qingshengii]|uniref:Uncharacterized protein n=1 Tax=Mesorhizobium qingshengii TaxID=1165689 RepID=A0A1G5ZRD1_9HYPH|nr:hypothetical protein [Mesorhizobium qingshengii]SDA97361.1 hypothetical protein SAMN02927914_05854 [Mesorhizobium qingshengii]